MKRAAILLSLGVAACEPAPPVVPPAPTVEPAPVATSAAEAPPKLDAVPRADLNRLAAELDLPLFWIADANDDRTIDPAEVAVLWGTGHDAGAFVQNGAFTPAFLTAYASIAKAHAEGPAAAGLSEAEKKRRALVRAELAQGQPALVRSDFRNASPEDRAVVEHVLAASRIIERLFEKQLGTFGLDATIPADDPASRRMFYRNHGPFCQAPKTEKDPACNALPTAPERISGLYPKSVQGPKFCEKLEARKDQKALLGPFTAVVEKDGGLEAVPYTVAFKDDMAAVSRELSAAAAKVTSAGEAPLKAYLAAAAQAFLDNDWNPADEAWAKMNVHNSKWYLRVGPDETYDDPCSRKAGFHVSFARINQDSLVWQKRLDPVKNEMEARLAELAGKPYKARKIAFHLPDFIEIVANAGDSRSALGATVGQSLPNWGPVANGNRGRTVVMTNLYTDPDSRAAAHEKAASIVCKSSFDPAALDPALSVMGTVLHEAAHNLGPAHEYKAKGKTDAETFGGPLAGMLEELKAQTSALFLTDWLVIKGITSPTQARAAHKGNILWAFGHISEGMYDANKTPKPYAQLAAIQVGSFLRDGALAWRPDAMAENGRDRGCLDFVEEKLPAAIAALEKRVLGIKARGDKAEALKMRDELVDAEGEWSRLRAVIAERWLRLPKASFVYAIEM